MEKDYFSKTWGDFFPKNKHLGGMWDYLGLDEDGEIDTVFEMKTTKRVEDWKDDVPEYYSLQASLYGYLMGVDDIVMVASFLEDSDYEHPEKFTPNVNNTITVEFKISEKYLILLRWWLRLRLGGRTMLILAYPRTLTKRLTQIF